MKRLLVMTAGVSATIGLANLPVWTAAAEDRREPVPIEQLAWAGERLSMTSEAATRDSDGDGWSDWYERLEGTDPFDAASHPTSLSLEVVDGTVFVQSVAFPDRLVMVDLHLPESADSVGDLLASLDGLGSTTLGKLREQMDASVAAIAGDGVASILEEMSAAMGSDLPGSFGRRVGGIDVALISDVHQGTNSAGERQVTITNPEGFTLLTFHDDGTTSAIDVDRSGIDADGNGEIVVVKTSGGKLLAIVGTHYENGQPVSSISWDPTNGVTEIPPTTVATEETKATVQPTETTEKPTETTAKPTDSTEKPTETTTGGYRDPDADTFVMPTAEEVAERVAFLRDVNARFGPRADVALDPPKDRPGVADPEEPPCSDERCVVFVDLGAPDLTRTSGGCPPTHCTATGPRLQP